MHPQDHTANTLALLCCPAPTWHTVFGAPHALRAVAVPHVWRAPREVTEASELLRKI